MLRWRSLRVTDEGTPGGGERKSGKESARDIQEVVQHCRREGRRIWATITRRSALRLSSFPRATGAAVTYTLSRFRNNNYLIPEANGEMRDSTERKKERGREKEEEGDRFPFDPPRDSFRESRALRWQKQ